MHRLVVIGWGVAVLSMAGLSASAAIAPATSDEAMDASSIASRESPLGVEKPERPSLTASPAPASNEPAAKSANPLWGIPLASLSATRDRPIFSASRRPPAPVVAPVATLRPPPPRPKEPEKPRLLLVGTVIGESESFGIFVERSSKVSLRLRLGEERDGWVLRAVQGREVVLEKDAQTAIISMPQPGKASEGEVRMAPATAERDGYDNRANSTRTRPPL
ncbi:general secretion pathway protein GspN [Bradyrhizobium sp. ISRA442]|uniref:hypothetical protein n=1 Tax=Bradyrhizobium sp. ISRA442 TaxID=2866197 RepID=UPI00311B1552